MYTKAFPLGMIEARPAFVAIELLTLLNPRIWNAGDHSFEKQLANCFSFFGIDDLPRRTRGRRKR